LILGNLFARDEPTQFIFSQFAQAVEVCHLSFQGVVGAVKPKSAVGSAVDAQGPTNGITKLTVTNRVVSGKNLDPIR